MDHNAITTKNKQKCKNEPKHAWVKTITKGLWYNIKATIFCSAIFLKSNVLFNHIVNIITSDFLLLAAVKYSLAVDVHLVRSSLILLLLFPRPRTSTNTKPPNIEPVPQMTNTTYLTTHNISVNCPALVFGVNIGEK